MLSRSFMPESERRSILAYTPMFHARLYSETQKYRDQHFQATKPSDPTTLWLDGNPDIDRPLFVQFCANDPQHLLSAAKLVAPYCDAVDLNLGCPQGIARKGHYGSFLQEDQDLIYRLINILHENLDIPVTAKIRILDTKEATLKYAQNVLSAGASILTVHGRRREQKGHLTGVADWEYIRFLRENLPPETVLFANGNILEHGDIAKCLAATGADGVMSAEGNLSNPGIFAPDPPLSDPTPEFWRGKDGKGGWRVDAVFRRYLDILHQYVLGSPPPTRKPLWVPGTEDAAAAAAWLDGPAPNFENKKTYDGPSKRKAGTELNPNCSALQGHMFHMLRHFVTRHHDVRNALAQARSQDIGQFEAICSMVERKVAEGIFEYEKTDGRSVADPEGDAKLREKVGEQELNGTETSAGAILRCKRPWWVVQPIIRPLPSEAMAKGAIQPTKKEKKRMAAEEEQRNGAAKKIKGEHDSENMANVESKVAELEQKESEAASG